MKQFPYAQQIIWENDVGQIEWVEDHVFVEYSVLYLIKTKREYVYVGNWRKYLEDGVLRFVTNEHVFHLEEVECWAKI